MPEYPSNATMRHSTDPAMPKPAGRHDAAFRGGQALVWGGVALGVAGLTAATVMAVRRLAEQPDPKPVQPVMAPRFAELSAEEREAIRRRVREQAREDYTAAARERAAASAKRHKRKSSNVAKDLTRTATELTASLTGVATAVAAASRAFRSVSGQAPGVMGEFIAAADQLRALLNGSPNGQAQGNSGDAKTERR